jgi:hypothetical protein
MPEIGIATTASTSTNRSKPRTARRGLANPIIGRPRRPANTPSTRENRQHPFPSREAVPQRPGRQSQVPKLVAQNSAPKTQRQCDKPVLKQTRLKPRASASPTLTRRAILMTLSWDTRYNSFDEDVGLAPTVQRKRFSSPLPSLLPRCEASFRQSPNQATPHQSRQESPSNDQFHAICVLGSNS